MNNNSESFQTDFSKGTNASSFSDPEKYHQRVKKLKTWCKTEYNLYHSCKLNDNDFNQDNVTSVGPG